jgi:hypothetical protein
MFADNSGAYPSGTPANNTLQATSFNANIRPGLSGTDTAISDESIGDKEKS